MGGSRRPLVHSEDNLITLRRRCHRNLHEGEWELERSPQVLRSVDRRTGQEIMRRFQASDFDASSFFQLLNVMDGSLADALTQVPYLDDEQLVEAFSASRSLGKRSWLLQAATFYEAQRRSIYGDRSLEAIAAASRSACVRHRSTPSFGRSSSSPTAPAMSTVKRKASTLTLTPSDLPP